MTVSRKLALASLERHDRDMTGRLLEAQGRVEAAALELRRAREMRVGVIGEALEEGWTRAKVARVLGASKQLVGQWLRAAERTDDA